MSHVADGERTKDSAHVATSLGWPEQYVGFFGASASLLSLGEPFRRLDSNLTRVEERRELSQARVQLAVLRSVARRLK